MLSTLTCRCSSTRALRMSQSSCEICAGAAFDSSVATCWLAVAVADPDPEADPVTTACPFGCTPAPAFVAAKPLPPLAPEFILSSTCSSDRVNWSILPDISAALWDVTAPPVPAVSVAAVCDCPIAPGLQHIRTHPKIPVKNPLVRPRARREGYVMTDSLLGMLRSCRLS